MAKFRMVYLEFWSDPRVVEEMTPEDKYFFLYLLTNPNTTQSGIYQITKKQIAFDTGYSMESVNALIDRFQNHHKLIIYNPDTRELAVKNWGKHNLNRGGKPMIDCIVSELKGVRDIELIKYVGEHVDNSSIKALYDTYHDTSTSSGQEEEKEEEKEEKEEEEYNIPPSAPFDDFWIIYPRKNAKKDAESAFKALLKQKVSLDDIMTATKNYAKQCVGKEQEYIKLPATFLRKERWKDYLQVVPATPTRSVFRGKGQKKLIPTVQSTASSSSPITPEELAELRALARKFDQNGG